MQRPDVIVKAIPSFIQLVRLRLPVVRRVGIRKLQALFELPEDLCLSGLIRVQFAEVLAQKFAAPSLSRNSGFDLRRVYTLKLGHARDCG